MNFMDHEGTTSMNKWTKLVQKASISESKWPAVFQKIRYITYLYPVPKKFGKNLKISEKKIYFESWDTLRVSLIRCSKILRIPIRIRIRDTPNFAYEYLAYPYFLEHW